MAPEWVIEELGNVGLGDLAEDIASESDPDGRILTRGAISSGIEVPESVSEWASDPIIESPSGWSFRESQENGDNVDCWECGDPLNDDFPIVNDDAGYAYHENCLDTEQPAKLTGGN